MLWVADTCFSSSFSGALESWSSSGCLEPSSDSQNRDITTINKSYQSHEKNFNADCGIPAGRSGEQRLRPEKQHGRLQPPEGIRGAEGEQRPGRSSQVAGETTGVDSRQC